MKICIPVENKEGLEAKVKGHFGSAEFFIIYDTGSNLSKIIENNNNHHSHGICHPLGVLGDENIDAVVCTGIGARAVMKLNEGGVRVYRTQADRVSEVVENYKNNTLQEISPGNSCSSHGCG